ncbi:hypothetical protein SALBM217S_06730 [Streptomyces griseoloalbus]
MILEHLAGGEVETTMPVLRARTPATPGRGATDLTRSGRRGAGCLRYGIGVLSRYGSSAGASG